MNFDTPMEQLNRAVTLRWPIEQCFEECKSYLGMGHCEARSWNAWHRHMPKSGAASARAGVGEKMFWTESELSEHIREARIPSGKWLPRPWPVPFVSSMVTPATLTPAGSTSKATPCRQVRTIRSGTGRL